MSDWITVWSSFGSAIVGGLIAAVVAFLANRQAHRFNRKLVEVEKQKEIDSILHAIRIEMKVMMDDYEFIRERLEKVEDGKPFAFFFKITRDYFIVYPNNTGIVGQIGDSELCTAIITAYHKASVFIDSIEVNNWNSERLLEYEKRKDQTVLQNEWHTHVKGMAGYVTSLRKNYQDLKQESEKLCKAIEDYRSHHSLAELR